MSATQKDHSSSNMDPQEGQIEMFDFSAPLGSIQSGRLVIVSEARQLELKADPAMPELYQARFWHSAPRVWVQESSVSIEYRRAPANYRPGDFHGPFAEISLNGSIPWEIELHKGISHLNADLHQLQIRSLDILGTASQVRLRLSRPTGTSYIYSSGGIDHAAIHIPPSTGVRIQISGGASDLVFGNQRFGSTGEEINLKSPNYESATSRYEICIVGGARDLIIIGEADGGTQIAPRE